MTMRETYIRQSSIKGKKGGCAGCVYLIMNFYSLFKTNYLYALNALLCPWINMNNL